MNKSKNYLITSGIILLFAAVLAWYRGLPEAESFSACMGILSDCFFVPGVLFTGVGALRFAASRGAYDLFSFGGGSVVRWFIPGMNKERYDDYYQYKQYKERKRKKPGKHLILCGAVSLLVSVAALLLYSIG